MVIGVVGVEVFMGLLLVLIMVILFRFSVWIGVLVCFRLLIMI